MTKSEKIKFAYLVSYLVLLIIGIVFYAIFQEKSAGIYILIVDIAFAVTGIIGFVILHNQITIYHCHNCNTDFKANVFDTIIGEDKGVNAGKKVTCKSCGKKDFYKVVRK